MGDTSHAVTRAPSTSRASVTAMQPLPVPMSSRAGAASLRAAADSTTQAHRSSVSGLGMSTPGSTANGRPQNSASPSTYCTGSAFIRRRIISHSACWSSADNCVTLPQ